MNRLLRNAAIGAAFVSYRALIYRDWFAFVTLFVGGALSGCLYTLLEPLVRERPYLHYLPWILCGYLVLFGALGGAAILTHDRESIDILTNPWFIGFGLIATPIAAYAAARMFEDK